MFLQYVAFVRWFLLFPHFDGVLPLNLIRVQFVAQSSEMRGAALWPLGRRGHRFAWDPVGHEPLTQAIFDLDIW